MTSYANQDKLIQRLFIAAKKKEKFTFLLGSGLTSGSNGQPGVSNVQEIIDEIYAALKENDSFHFIEDEIKSNINGNQYQIAMKVLLECEGQTKLNEVIVKAVLKSRINSSSSLLVEESNITTKDFEKDVDNWNLNDGVSYLSKLFVSNNSYFSGPVLTSNFDPLIEIGIRKFGGDPTTIYINNDGTFDNIIGDSKKVVHFHGYWNGGDTLHTVDQITRHRPQLKGGLKKLLQDTTLVVIGYGGWDDALTKALIELSSEGGTNYNILWTFFQNDDAKINDQYKHLIDNFGSSLGQRIVFYKGIDSNTFFPKLFKKLEDINNKSTQGERVDVTPYLIPSKKDKKTDAYQCDIPPSIENLVGRKKELESLSNKNFKVVFITGMGGQGKSGLASYYITKLLNTEKYWEYWDWRDFKEEENRFQTKIVSMIERITDGRIRPSSLIDENIDSLISLFFIELGNKKIVFALDNIDSSIDFEKYIPIGPMGKFCEEALRRSHNSKFIFTCRPEIAISNGSLLPLHLKGLTLEETTDFFKIFNINFKESDKEELIKKSHLLTDGHPLWLTLIVGQALRGKEVVFNLIEDVKNNIDIHSTNLAEKTLDAIWKNLIYDLQVLLRGIAELNKPEPENNITLVLEDDLSYHKVRNGLRSLRKLNLVEIKNNQLSNKDEFDLHPLVKHYVRNKFPKTERKKYITSCVKFYGRLIIIFKKTLSHESPFTIFENWISKIELEITNEDYISALSGLHEIHSPMRSAGFVEEYFRVLKLLFDKIDWSKAIENEFNYFHDQFSEYIEILTIQGKFEVADYNLEYYRKLITGKGYHYIIYCDLKCYLFWYKEEFPKAIEWAEKGIELKNAGNIDLLINLNHNYALSLRDSKQKENIEKALEIFKRGEKIETILAEEIALENKFGAFYGNIGRCFFYLSKIDEALICYKKSFILLLEENDPSSISNRGYACFWIGEGLHKKKMYKLAYCFFTQAYNIWENISPPRTEKANIKLLQLKDTNKIDNATISLNQNEIEKKCHAYIFEE